MTKNKNNVLPTYEATYENMNKALADGTIDSPCWVYLSDREILTFISFETVDGEKVLTPHIMLWDRLEKIDQQLEGLVDPETGETISVTSYVENQVAPVETQVNTVTSDVEVIKDQVGNVIILLSDDVKEEE